MDSNTCATHTNKANCTILDVDDFSLKANVQVRFEITSLSGTAAATDWQIFDPVLVGWRVP